MIGGLGTVMGPVVGAALLTPAGEGLAALVQELGLDAPGVKAVAYGLLLIAVIWVRPSGIWPWLAKRLGVS
jgi:branched-chain amino acid transport system permease protein